MKALVCGECGDIRALHPDPSDWVTCRCGQLSGHWKDPYRGIAEFAAEHKNSSYLLGLHNGVLGPALQGKLAMFPDFQVAHEAATHSPGYIFDKTKCGCWAVPVRIGLTSDTSFVEGPPPLPAPSHEETRG